MAKNTLPVNFQDDILNSAMDGKRRFKLIPNSDGTYSLEDATTYDQVGSNFGAGQINATNQAVNESADKNKVIQDIEAIRNVTEDGYIAGAIALKHVDNSLEGHGVCELLAETNSTDTNNAIEISNIKNFRYLLFIILNGSNDCICNTLIPVDIVYSYNKWFAKYDNLTNNKTYDAVVKIISDTSVNLYVTDSTRKACLYGIK